MNIYTKRYLSLLRNAKLQNRSKSDGEYYEAHHIRPRCLYPQFGESEWNTVLLTAREHYIAHWILCKIYKNKNKGDLAKLSSAFHFMVVDGQNGQRNVSSHHYAIARKYYSCYHPNKTAEGRKKISESWTDARRQETADRNRLLKTGMYVSDETRKKLSIALKGREVTEEHRKKISKGRKEYWKKNKSRLTRKVSIEGTIYDNAVEASKVYNIDPNTVRAKCRNDKYEEWKYI